VKPNEGVKVVLGQQERVAQEKKPSEEIKRPTIVAQKDEGKRAKEILEKIKQKKLSQVVIKNPEPPEQAPQPQVQEPKKKSEKKPKKIRQSIVIEDEAVVIPDLPDGGPRLPDEDLGPGPDIGAEDAGPEIVIDDAVEKIKKPRKRSVKKAPQGVIELGDENDVIIGDTPIAARLPPPPVFNVKVSNYYMNNREIFVNFINSLFDTYKDDLMDDTKNISCDDIDKDTGEMSLLTHQKIVRDYINLYTPYRGLLLFHGLGSGKTCSSIAIAEGMKSSRKIIVMTPASLRRNYMEEIKKCGDLIYRKNQYWEWIPTEGNEDMVNKLSGALSLPREYIRRHSGAWLVNISKPNNYKELTASDKKILNDQLDEMITNKYTFINYNGLRRDKFRQLTNDFANNIFDDSVVIIDEAHNLISRIVNKINKARKFATKPRGPGSLIPQPLALILYEFLLRADNCRVILLTGTPMINYPNEIGILFNILRGYIKSWSFRLSSNVGKKIEKSDLDKLFFKEKVLDYVDYNSGSKALTITRNPYGFENKITESSGYKGVTNEKKEKKNSDGKTELDLNGKIIYEERGQMSDSDFVKRMTKLLKSKDINAIPDGTTYSVNIALPDTLEEFNETFINASNATMNNVEKFKKRIIGLTSYFRSAQEELLPAYDKNFNRHVVRIQMSDYQFKVYEEYRQEERKLEKPSNTVLVDKNGLFKEPSSTYRIFSRLACNFAMPTPPGRPKPAQYRANDENEKELKKVEKKLKEDEKRERMNQEVIAPELVEQGPDKKKRDREEAKKEKAEEKVRKELEKNRKAEEKEAEKQRKAEEKEAEKRRKAEEKEAEKQRKAEEKEAEKRRKAEEKTAKKQRRSKKVELDIIDNIEAEAEDELGEEQEGGAGDEDPFVEFIESQDEDEAAVIEGYKDVDANLRELEELEGDELLDKMGSAVYKESIRHALSYLKLHANTYLSPEGLKTYSPKFLAMLDNIEDPEHPGLHLIYSQFRSMEGIGIFSMTLETNGFARFKIKRNGDGWEINMSEEDMGKPCYALYTGTEDADEREIIRNIYNGKWDYIPNNIATQLRAKSSNNNMGEIIKVLMITSAGSEGITLHNTRYVHIMEPYWHPVRSEQVIGRARRICSHKNLPKELQTVDVFIYIMTFTPAQLRSDYAHELVLKDLSKRPPYNPQSSDEKLFEISSIKEQLTSQILKAVKESSIDCAIHSKSNIKEGLKCLRFNQPSVTDFSYNPNYTQDQNDTIADINKVTIGWEGKEFTLKSTGKKYILRQDTMQVYDYDSVMQARAVPGVEPILIGRLVKTKDGKLELVKDR
jgi:hypothetical protein